jgi:hypothetical protein
VSAPGGTANSITLTGTVREVADFSAGDITKAVVSVSLRPAVAGTQTIVCPVTNFTGTLTAVCSNVPVNAYALQWEIGGNSYQGTSVRTVMAVYDPSLGFVTGSGTVAKDVVSSDFSINVKYQKEGAISGGGVLWVQHQPSGDVTVAPTVLTAMAIVGNTAVIDGQASVNRAAPVPFRLVVTDNVFD